MAYNKLIDLNLLSNFLNKIKGLIPTKVSNLENDSGYINEITSSDIITALGYTPSSTDALPLAGGTMSGNINMGSNKVTNLSAPTTNGDATSKEYVDNLITIGSTQPTTTQTKIWLDPADTTNSTTEIWVPTISEMNEALEGKEQAGLGISNASVGDFICVSAVDANGKPTSWTRVAQSGIINSSNIVAVSDTQPTETENKLWVDTDAGTGSSYQIPTVAEMDAADNTVLGNLATIESSPATAAHAVDDYIVYNGQLYKVTATIARGVTLDPTLQSGNITAADIGEAIKEINNHYPSNIKMLSIAANGTQSGFNIQVPLNASLIMFYVDNLGRVASVRKSSGHRAEANMLLGNFASVTSNDNNILLETGSWTRAIMIFTSATLKDIDVAVY